MSKSNVARYPCYRRNPLRAAAPGDACWPNDARAASTSEVSLRIETMGGPSYQRVYLCDRHRREADAAGLLRSLRTAK